MLHIFLVTCLICRTVALNMDQMFPFGPANGDLAEPRNDDGSVQVNININFPFFGTEHNVLFVDTNGDLTFDNGYSTYTPQAFPLTTGAKMVAPYWSDVDTMNNPGLVYYRETTDSTLLTTASAQIKNYFPDMATFQATWAFVTTWYNVTFYGGTPYTPTNTFQCALITDGQYSYAIYNYLSITWTTGTASGGNMSGLGGVPAQVGFDAGDGVNYFAIPESQTADVVNIGSMSNLNPALPGKYIFKINDAQIHNIPVVTIETCQAVTDPHFTTFDGYYYSPQEPPGSWYLAAAPVTIPNDTLSWEVWFSTSFWYGNPSATCITAVEIDIEVKRQIIKSNVFTNLLHAGLNNASKLLSLFNLHPKRTSDFVATWRRLINDLDTNAPWYYPNQENATFSVVAYGQFGYLLNTIDQVKVSFTGDNDNTLRIQAPLETYGNDTQGVCGNMDGNPNNDPTCPTGDSIDNCWQRNNATTTTTTKILSTTTSPRTVATTNRTTATQRNFTMTTNRNRNATTVSPRTVATSMAHRNGTTATNRNRNTTITNPRSVATTKVHRSVTVTTNRNRNVTATDRYGSSNFPSRTTPRTRNTTPRMIATTTTYSSQCSPQMQQQIDQQCEIILNATGPFSICVTNATSIAVNYYKSCTYDLCINNTDPNVLCYELQSYADACMQALPSVTIQWRSEYFCPPNCSANAHYDDCASSCPATCGNPQAPLTCPLPCRGACTCDQGYIYDNGQCILPDQCGCTDTSGIYHQYGTSWVTPNCQQNCTCGDNHAIVCNAMTPCAANATCQVAGGQRNCYCNAGFTGDATNSCSPIDYCASNPCKNGASCWNQYLGYSCICQAGFSGTNCQINPTTTTKGTTAQATTSTKATTQPPRTTTAQATTSTKATTQLPRTTTARATTTKRATTQPPRQTTAQATTAKKSATTQSSGSFDCTNLPSGNYADPNNPCAHYFYMCSNGYTYKMSCPANLVFNPAILDCDYPQDVPGCNSK